PEFKLITRKCECLARLGRVDEAKTVLETAKRANNLDSSDVARLNQLDKLVRTSKPKTPPSVQSRSSVENQIKAKVLANTRYPYKPNPNLTELNAKVAIREDPDSPNGRRLVALEEITCGITIMFTKPFVSCLQTKFNRHFC